MHKTVTCLDTFFSILAKTAFRDGPDLVGVRQSSIMTYTLGYSDRTKLFSKKSSSSILESDSVKKPWRRFSVPKKSSLGGEQIEPFPLFLDVPASIGGAPGTTRSLPSLYHGSVLDLIF